VRPLPARTAQLPSAARREADPMVHPDDDDRVPRAEVPPTLRTPYHVRLSLGATCNRIESNVLWMRFAFLNAIRN
jgi:hypothetical protein